VTTLLILAYNEESYIYDLINDYKDSFEKILVVDDCSNDGTSEILKNQFMKMKI
jgi:glycosyltransferase involved in cell wall biosynthesis